MDMSSKQEAKIDFTVDPIIMGLTKTPPNYESTPTYNYTVVLSKTMKHC